MKDISERIVFPVEIKCNEPSCECLRVASASADFEGYVLIAECPCGHPTGSHTLSREM